MAGAAKPTVVGLNREVKTTVRTYSLANQTKAEYAFDGICAYGGYYRTCTIDFWTSSYIEISIPEPCNIWRCGYNDYPQNRNVLKILALQNNTWVDVSSKYNLATTVLYNNQWAMFIKAIPAGIYRIGFNNNRVDSEWYCELCKLPDKFLIKMDNKLYNINSSYYNAGEHIYNSLPNTATLKDGFDSITALFNQIQIGSDIFKPIDKFDNFKILSLNEVNFKIKGIKSSKELMVSKNNFSATEIGTVDYIKSFNSQSGNGKIKVVFSINNGKTWCTHNGETFVNISSSIPYKKYDELTNDELAQWNIAQEEIANTGILSDILATLDFNSLDFEQLLFAYVLLRPKYTDVIEISKLDLQFDKKDFMKKMKDTEYDTYVHDDKLRIISLINSDLIYIKYIYETK